MTTFALLRPGGWCFDRSCGYRVRRHIPSHWVHCPRLAGALVVTCSLGLRTGVKASAKRARSSGSEKKCTSNPFFAPMRY